MIGDGVNDIPALKSAQLAIAMRSGSPATRSVADIVLMEDSFAALSTALLEGQRIRQGMEAIVRLFLVRTLSVSVFVLGAALINVPFPLTPRQTAVIAGLTVGIPAMALAALARPGRGPNLLLPSALAFVLPASVAIGLSCFALYGLHMKLGSSVETARTSLTLTATLLGIGIIPYAVQPPDAWTSLAAWHGNRHVALLTLTMFAAFWLSALVAPLRSFFELAALGVLDYVWVLAAVMLGAAVLRLLWDERLARVLESQSQRLLEKRTL
jgi:cation-transporting ATPase E